MALDHKCPGEVRKDALQVLMGLCGDEDVSVCKAAVGALQKAYEQVQSKE